MSPICLLLCSLLIAADPQVAQQVIQQMYGSDLQRVAATSSPADDIELAKTLLQNAQRSDTGPALRYALAEQALHLTQSPSDGYAVAAEALKVMAATQPDQAAKLADQRLELELRRYRYTRGDQRTEAARTIVGLLRNKAASAADSGDYGSAVRLIQQALGYGSSLEADTRDTLNKLLEQYSAQWRTIRQIDALKQRLAANPTDAQAAGSLVRLYVVDMDRPADAQPYLQAAGDADLQHMVNMANQPLSNLKPADLLALGHWYQDLSASANDSSKNAMLAHAQGAYQIAATHPDADEATRMSAKLAGFQVEKLLSSAAISTPVSSSTAGWTDLIPLIDPTKDSLRGKWTIDGGRVIGEGGSAASPISLLLPISCNGNYELAVSVTSLDKGSLAVGIQVGNGGTVFVYGAGPQQNLAGLTTSKSNAVKDGPATVKAVAIQTAQTYLINIEVQNSEDAATIRVRVNNQPVVNWTGKTSEIGVGTAYAAPQAGFFLGCWGKIACDGVKIHPARGDIKINRANNR